MSKDIREKIFPAKSIPVRDQDISSTREESGLARWSRRKAAARQAPSTRDVDTADESLLAQESDNKPVDNSIAQLTDQDMPPLESLDEHSDYSGFLSPGVSEKLRRQALRKLFHLDQYNITDGLDDYAEDYTKFDLLGNIVTADMRLRQHRAEKSLKPDSSPADNELALGETTGTDQGDSGGQADIRGGEASEHGNDEQSIDNDDFTIPDQA